MQEDQRLRDEDKKFALSSSQRYLKESIRQHLSLLLRELGHYEQTTHGSFASRGCSMLDMLTQLKKCYEEPTAWNISELDARIGGWLKSEQEKQS